MTATAVDARAEAHRAAREVLSASDAPRRLWYAGADIPVTADRETVEGFAPFEPVSGGLVILPSAGDTVQHWGAADYCGTVLECVATTPSAAKGGDGRRVNITLLQPDGRITVVERQRASHADARHCLTGRDDREMVQHLIAARAEIDRLQAAAEKAEKDHQSFMDKLVEKAHEYADRAQLCGEFDDFMEEQGLPARTIEVEGDVTVTIEVQVTVPAVTRLHEGNMWDDFPESSVTEPLERLLNDAGLGEGMAITSVDATVDDYGPQRYQ